MVILFLLLHEAGADRFGKDFQKEIFSRSMVFTNPLIEKPLSQISGYRYNESIDYALILNKIGYNIPILNVQDRNATVTHGQINEMNQGVRNAIFGLDQESGLWKEFKERHPEFMNAN